MPKIVTALFLSISNSSSRKATAGCASDTLDVIPARKSNINHKNANNAPIGIF